MIAEYIKLEWDKKYHSTIDLGIFDIQASATVVPYKATVIARNTEICQLDGMAQADTYDLSIAFGNGESYLVKFWQQSTNLGTIKSLIGIAGKMIAGDEDAKNAVMPKIYDANGNMIGGVSFMPVHEGGVQSYYFYRLEIMGRILDTYIVGMDHKVYFCMYEQNNRMVATVNKVLPVRNGKARYTMHIGNDEDVQVVTTMTAILHQLIYENQDKQSLGISSENLISPQRGLREKYQPGFVEKVIAQEGSANLPENMPLVAEKVRESQGTLQLILKRIGVIVFLVMFVGIIIVMLVNKK